MSLSQALNIGLSGLSAAQSAMWVASNNIANAKTPYHTKQYFSQSSLVLNGAGVGVGSTQVLRKIDEGLERTLRSESSLLHQILVADKYHQRIQPLFGNVGDQNSLSHRINNLFKTFQTLVMTPNNSTAVSDTVENLNSTLKSIKNLSHQIQDIRLDADVNIQHDVQAINQALKELDFLNKNISEAFVTNRPTASLEDKRDHAIRQISEKIDITVQTRQDKSVIVYIPSGSVLLDEKPHPLEYRPVTHVTPELNVDRGSFGDILLEGSNITNLIRSGSINGNLQIRDSVIPSMQAQLDELVYSMKESLNFSHNKGTAFAAKQDHLFGTVFFSDPAAQEVKLQDGDVMVALYNDKGQASITGSLKRDIMANAAGPWKIIDVANNLQQWMRDKNINGLVNFVGGKLQIQTRTKGIAIGFTDVVDNSHQQKPATFLLDLDGPAGGEAQIKEGFSSIFGLNDLLVSVPENNHIIETKVLPDKALPKGAAFLYIYDETSATVPIATARTYDNLYNMAADINEEAPDKLHAYVIREGDGYRLRIEHKDKKALSATSFGPQFDVIKELGITTTKMGIAQNTQVRHDILQDNNRFIQGSLKYNAAVGYYEVNASSNNISQEYVEAMTKNRVISAAGGFPETSISLINYSAEIVARVSEKANISSFETKYQKELVGTLDRQKENESGVNIDEELSSLIIYEKSYAASARVISTTSEMMDLLLAIV